MNITKSSSSRSLSTATGKTNISNHSVSKRATSATPSQKSTPTTHPKDRITTSEESKSAATTAATLPVNLGAWNNDSSKAAPTDSVAPAKGSSKLGSATLRSGSRGENVESLQRMLNEKTGAGLDVDGKFGKKTLDAVKKFQTSQGIDVDGLVGKDTKAAFTGPTPAASEGKPSASGGSTSDKQGDAPVSKAEATATAEAAAQKAAAEGAGKQPAAGGSSQAQQTGTPGTGDTSWTEKLPKKLQPHADAFVAAGKKYGVDPRFLAAISMQETGGGTSSAFRNKNNAMGITGSSGVKRFGSVTDSINAQAHSLTRDGGYYSGTNTINGVSGIYAPVGAKNDPGNLNRSWQSGVNNFYQRLGGASGAQVKGFGGS